MVPVLHSLSWSSSLTPPLSHVHSLLLLAALTRAHYLTHPLYCPLALPHTFAFSWAHPFLCPCAHSLCCSSSLILMLPFWWHCLSHIFAFCFSWPFSVALFFLHSHFLSLSPFLTHKPFSCFSSFSHTLLHTLVLLHVIMPSCACALFPVQCFLHLLTHSFSHVLYPPLPHAHSFFLTLYLILILSHMNLLFLPYLLFLTNGHNLSNGYSSFSWPHSLTVLLEPFSCSYVLSQPPFLLFCILSCDFVLTLYHTLTLLHTLSFSPVMFLFPAYSYSHALISFLFFSPSLSFPLPPSLSPPSFSPPIPFSVILSLMHMLTLSTMMVCLLHVLCSCHPHKSCDPVPFLTYPCLNLCTSFFLCSLTSFVPPLSFPHTLSLSLPFLSVFFLESSLSPPLLFLYLALWFSSCSCSLTLSFSHAITLTCFLFLSHSFLHTLPFSLPYSLSYAPSHDPTPFLATLCPFLWPCSHTFSCPCM